MFIELRSPGTTPFSPDRLAEICASALFFLGTELARNNGDGFIPNGMNVSRVERNGITVTVSAWDTHTQMVVMLETSGEGTVPSPVRVFVKSSHWDVRLIPLESSEFGKAKKRA